MSVPAIYLHEDDQCVFLGTGEGTRNGCKISVDDGVLRVCAHGEAVRRIKLFWPVTFVDGTKILADQWERGYGALSWHEPDEAEVMPWYFLAYSEGETQCFGAQTGPSGLCWWQIRKDGISLYADISCGADAVLLNGRTLVDVVKESLDGGVTMIQLREKSLDEGKFLEEAKELQALCRERHVPFIVNDNVDIAKAMDADGVHVGQDDMAALDARAKLGPDKLIGVSAHTVEEALLAEKQGADYLGVGAVFPTSSKSDVGEMSYETLKAICKAVSIPVVAIGGISGENVGKLAGSGICGVAVISAIYAAKDVKAAAADLKTTVEEMLRA